MADGVLPRQRAVHALGTPGRGEACALCGAPIETNTTAVEVPLGARGRLAFLHLDCFHTWDAMLARGDAGASDSDS